MRLLLAAIAALVVFAASPASAGTLDAVMHRGFLLCGTGDSAPGFGYLDPKTGTLEGLDVDFCRAVAAAVLGDATKVKFVTVTDKSRFNALLTGQVDVVFAHSTITITRESAVGVTFLPVNFYDGTGVMVKASLGVHRVADLDGATICTTQGSGTEVFWANYAKAHHWNSSTKILTFQDDATVFAALNAGRCNAMSTDRSALAGWKGNAPDPSALEILPETLDRSPFAGFVPATATKWATALRWVAYATIEAELDGITSRNLAHELTSADPYVRNFLGVAGAFGRDLGLPADFVQKIIGEVGNYGEIYARNLGPGEPWAIERKGSLNALYTDGGLMYSPPWY